MGLFKSVRHLVKTAIKNPVAAIGGGLVGVAAVDLLGGSKKKSNDQAAAPIPVTTPDVIQAAGIVDNDPDNLYNKARSGGLFGRTQQILAGNTLGGSTSSPSGRNTLLGS